MNINFNGFNIGQMGQNPFEEIQKICTEHFACENCPAYANYGLHSSINNNNIVTMCQKIAERIVREQQNGNS